jgi:hypothetical protein
MRRRGELTTLVTEALETADFLKMPLVDINTETKAPEVRGQYVHAGRTRESARQPRNVVSHRLGQAHPVHMVHLLTKDSIEERVWETLKLKKSLFAGVLSGKGLARC